MKTEKLNPLAAEQLEMDSSSFLGHQITVLIDRATRCVIACRVGKPHEKGQIERCFADFQARRSVV